MKTALAMLCLSLCVPSAALAGSSSLVSGKYGAHLKLAVAPLDQGRVTGYFESLDKFCQVYFHGTPKGEIFQLAVANASDFQFASYGELHVRYEGNKPVVQLQIAMPPGCEGSAPELPGSQHELQYKADWKSIRLVRAERALFHREAHDSTKQRSYVVQWDAVAVERETPAFAQVKYLNDKVYAVGWLRQQDVYPPDVSPALTYVRTQLPPMEGQWPSGTLPIDVRAYLNARERCEHFGGEAGNDSKRKAFLAEAMERECTAAVARFSKLQRAYASRAADANFLKLNAPSQ